MIRFKTATILLTVLIGSFAFAQDSPQRIQIFGGYSLVHADNGGLTPLRVDADLYEPNEPFSLKNYFQGWNAEGQYNANRWIGIAAEFSGRSGTPITASTGSSASGLPDLKAYTFLLGPVLSYRTKSKLTPFIHALFGFDRASFSAGPITGVAVPLSSAGTTYTDVAAALGGGVDYRFSRHVSLRLAQVDEFYTTRNVNKFYTSNFSGSLFQGFSTHQDNIRVSTGVVVRF
jgi:opacity protein-like surface antigen